jgi:hypothetical protein
MNFLVLIGIIESIERKEKNSILNLKIERNNNINRKI